jgi:hypothetical protein
VTAGSGNGTIDDLEFMRLVLAAGGGAVKE